MIAQVTTAGAVPAIEVREVHKRFAGDRKRNGRRKPFIAVNGVSLRVEQGEVFGLLGANGSGKSTLIRLISTLLYPDAGSVSVFGHDVVRDQRTVRRLLNRVSVEASFFKKLSAIENLMYAGRLYNLSGRETRERVVELLTQLGFSKAKIRAPLEELSRGMQQKVAISRALMTRPKLLLLDEPTTGLDPRSKRDVQELIANLHAQHGVTCVLTTHDMDEAERLCDRISIIDRGRIVALGTVEELKAAQDGVQTLEDVFFELVGRAWGDEEDDE